MHEIFRLITTIYYAFLRYKYVKNLVDVLFEYSYIQEHMSNFIGNVQNGAVLSC